MFDASHPEPSSPSGNTSLPHLRRELRSWTRDLAVALGLALVIIIFLYQPVKVEGTSMMPGLTDQERIFINKYTYRLGSDSIGREDLVVFHYPYDPSQSYIKRVIGLPGDAVEMSDGTVYVNGKKLDEPYVPDEYRDHLPAEQKWTVPAGKYFVLGDHRSSSNDSRAWGFVDRKEIYGKAVFVYWPLDKMGPVR
jgi:signal peptidase I